MFVKNVKPAVAVLNGVTVIAPLAVAEVADSDHGALALIEAGHLVRVGGAEVPQEAQQEIPQEVPQETAETEADETAQEFAETAETDEIPQQPEAEAAETAQQTEPEAEETAKAAKPARRSEAKGG